MLQIISRHVFKTCFSNNNNPSTSKLLNHTLKTWSLCSWFSEKCSQLTLVCTSWFTRASLFSPLSLEGVLGGGPDPHREVGGAVLDVPQEGPQLCKDDSQLVVQSYEVEIITMLSTSDIWHFLHSKGANVLRNKFRLPCHQVVCLYCSLPLPCPHLTVSHR